MDILLTEPIKAPNNNDTTIAMISETQEVVMNKALIDSFEISEDFVYTTAQDKYDDEVVSYVYRYRKGEPLVSLEDKDVILVDECVESGLTMMVSLKSVIERGAKNVYIATPILDKSVFDNLQSVCDGVFCPHKIEHYISVEYYFEKFDPISFKEIEDMMKVYANNRYNETMK
jgi:putative phosphoribosyl transferase